METKTQQLQLEVGNLRHQMRSLVPVPRELQLLRELIESIEGGAEEEVWLAVRSVLAASLKGDEARTAKVLSALRGMAGQ